jgi:hypothetical protein
MDFHEDSSRPYHFQKEKTCRCCDGQCGKRGQEWGLNDNRQVARGSSRANKDDGKSNDEDDDCEQEHNVPNGF